MSLLESKTRRLHRPSTTNPSERRIRHQALENLTAAGLSLGASIGATAVIWAVLRWLA
jgi:hypothetical protein